jgi:transposase
MLRPSFVPPPVIRRLRDSTRLRADLTKRAPGTISGWSSCRVDALIKVSSVASKLDGLSVRDMLEALIAGERDPAGSTTITRSWPACWWTRSTPRTASSLALIGTLTTRIEELLAAIPAAHGVDADGTTGPGAGSGPDAVVLLPAAATPAWRRSTGAWPAASGGRRRSRWATGSW